MNKKLSITLLVAMVGLLIIGFGGAASAEAAGKCETLLVNVSTDESTAFTDCRAFEAEAARYTGLAAFYTHETNVPHSLEAEAARYTGLAAFYTHETNVPRSIEAEAARYTGLAAFYAADGSMASQ